MSASVTWYGLTELREQLRKLPDDLAGEAGRIVEATANSAAFSVRTAYGAHRFSGNLQEHVVVLPGSHDRYGAAFVVKNTARHAVIFERGSYLTGVRKTREGWIRGRMPAFNIFVPTMIRARNLMFRELAAMLHRVTGWEVYGAAA